MKVDQDNSDLMMTEALRFDPSFKIVENKSQCLSLCVTSQNILIASFSEGNTLVGKVQGQEFHGFKLNVQEDTSFNSASLKNIWQRYGETLASFREVAFVPSRGPQNESRLYI
jgi:hypothetical protein